MAARPPYATSEPTSYVKLPAPPPQSILLAPRPPPGKERQKKEAEAEAEEQEERPECAGLGFLPDELNIHILSYMDVRSLSTVSLTSFRWYRLAQDCNGLARLLIQKHLHIATSLLCKSEAQATLIKQREDMKKPKPPVPAAPAAATPPGSPTARKEQPDDRIGFLLSSLKLLRDYFQKKREIINSPDLCKPEFAHLLSILTSQLSETLEVLENIVTGKRRMNQNFDIIELTLKRYHFQFVEMFPVDEAKRKTPISLIIEDPKARALWETHVGNNVCVCDFEEFFNDVILTTYKGKDYQLEDLRHCMAYFLNFPRDNTVTVYKWHILTRLFGPWDSFFGNLKQFVMGQGFLGLINRIRAEELLKKSGDLLIRFSRTVPWALAFSFNYKGQQFHRTNLTSSSTNEPIESFLRNLIAQYPSLELMALRVDGKSVYETATTGGYCEQNANYVVPP